MIRRRVRFPAWWRRAQGERLSALLILVLIALAATASGVLGRVDNLLYDLGQRIVSRPAPTDLIIVAIDERSLSKLGRWPWSRRLHASLIDKLHQDGARVIGLDLVFAEPDTADQPADAQLAEAIQRSGRVVLPVLLESSRSNGQVLETLPLPQLIEGAAGLGRVHAELDADGIARGIFLWEGVGAPVWPHFAQAVLAVSGTPNLAPPPADVASPSPFALLRDGYRRIAFLGPPGHMQTLSYVQALTGEFPPGLFRDKIVLVGATAAGMGDLLPTPVSGLRQPMAGVEFHANAIESMRQSRLIGEWPRAWTLALTALLAAMPLLWLPRLSPLTGLLASVGWFLLVAGGAVLLPTVVNLWVPVAGALLAILLAYPVWSWRRLESAGRFLDHEIRRLRRELGERAEAPGKARGDDPFEARIHQVQAAAQRLRHLQNERRETLAFISHDIRAPLASALMQLDDSRAQPGTLRAPLARALKLAEDFLRTSRAEMIDQGRFEELDVAALVHQAIDDAYSDARAKSVTLVRQLPDEPVWVMGEFGLLHRAVLNLVLNAVRYAPSGSAVTMRLTEIDRTVELRIEDEGAGIAPENQSRLFQRFSRGEQATPTEGAGLGLYFVRTVIEKHGGSVAVDSALGQGTCFSFRLPRR